MYALHSSNFSTQDLHWVVSIKCQTFGEPQNYYQNKGFGS